MGSRSTRYRIVCVIQHHGSTPQSGHYTVNVYTATPGREDVGTWATHDGARVSTPARWDNGEGYVYVYEQLPPN